MWSKLWADHSQVIIAAIVALAGMLISEFIAANPNSSWDGFLRMVLSWLPGSPGQIPEPGAIQNQNQKQGKQ